MTAVPRRKPSTLVALPIGRPRGHRTGTGASGPSPASVGIPASHFSFRAQETGCLKLWSNLDDFATGADFLLGHNLIDFDFPHLRAVNPELKLLGLPAVDTLRLNPLAFPRNPYHHLVKHYQDGQLKRGRINDPELDARLALEVFSNQLSALSAAPKELLTAWHWLTSANDGFGFDLVFKSIRNSPRPADTQALEAIETLLVQRRLPDLRPRDHR